MWKFELTVPDNLLPKFEALAAEHGLTPTVTLASPEDTQRAEKMASETWLLETIIANDTLGTYTVDFVRRRLRRYAWSSLNVVTKLTLEEFLLKKSGLGRGVFAAMAELSAAFACGASPADFPAHMIQPGEFSRWARLGEWDITSWAMFNYLTGWFLRTIPSINQGKVDEIKEHLTVRGFELKGP